MTYTNHEFDSIVEWKGIDVECTITFEYTPPTKMTIDCPSYESEVEINSVLIDGEKNQPAIDIRDLIGSEQTERLEIACFEYVKEQNESDAENLADYRYSMMKDDKDFI